MTHDSKTTIVRAGHSDIPQLVELLALLFEQEAEFQADSHVQSRALRAIMDASESGLILVLRHDALIVGMVSIRYTISTALGGRVALLEDMVVRPEYRGCGCGTLLMRAAMRDAERSRDANA